MTLTLTPEQIDNLLKVLSAAQVAHMLDEIHFRREDLGILADAAQAKHDAAEEAWRTLYRAKVTA